MSSEKRILSIIADQLGLGEEEVHADDRFEELDADSLDFVEFIIGLEEEYGLEISDDDVEDMKTVRQMIDYVDKRLAERKK